MTQFEYMEDGAEVKKAIFDKAHELALGDPERTEADESAIEFVGDVAVMIGGGYGGVRIDAIDWSNREVHAYVHTINVYVRFKIEAQEEAFEVTGSDVDRY
jgi:hypothetical protein